MPILGFGKQKISIADASFSLDANWQMFEKASDEIKFENQFNDVFSVNFFAKKPDIGASPGDENQIRRFYRNLLIQNQMALLQCDVTPVLGVPCVILQAKLKVPNRGFLYVTTCTVPKQDFSFVFKYQAIEAGITGLRETAVMAMLPTPEIDTTNNSIVGWCVDPYDSSLEYSPMRNKADDEKYDVKFPNHPLSRSRQFMSGLLGNIEFSANLLKSKPFSH